MRSVTEIWKNVPGLPEYYQVSNLGQIRSLAYVDRRGWNRKPKLLTPNNAEIYLSFDGKKWCLPLAALILKAFIGPPPPGHYLARHLDDNRNNNMLENLAWGTDQDNRNDAVRNGRSFVSYGHLNKPHTEATKTVLRTQRLGIPTGRKMSEAHKAAIWAGYRKRFPAKQIND